MSLSITEAKKVCQLSGNRCAMAECRRLLMMETTGDGVVNLGVIAHIVAQSVDGPRGTDLLPLEERDNSENLLLLCNHHHQQIDAAPATYTVERLRAIKAAHEAWVAQGMPGAPPGTVKSPPPFVEDTVYSTLLPVLEMPRYVFGFASPLRTREEVQKALGKYREREMAPFVLDGGQIYCFQDPEEPENPFFDLALGAPVTRVQSEEWWKDEDRARVFAQLLRRSLHKLTGRLGLNLDMDHDRYYFPLPEGGGEKEASYRALNASHWIPRKVVWRPITKKTGKPKKHWFHAAVRLRFEQVAPAAWCLSLRPEFRVTTDGVNPPRSDLIGSKVTKKKSRLFNNDLLGDIQFWRSFLSGGTPRIVLRFGTPGQHIVVDSAMLETTVTWPGLPAEHSQAFANVVYEDDLFSQMEGAELIHAADGDDDDG